MSLKMQVMYTLPRVFASKNVLRSTTSIRHKITKAELMKRLQRENKFLYGELVETRKQKAARERREKHSPVLEPSAQLNSTANNAHVSTEAHHINNSDKKPLSKVKFLAKSLPYSTKQILKITGAKKSVKATENLETILAVEKSGSIPSVENSNPVSDASNSQSNTDSVRSVGNERKNLSLPSGILINKMTSFSYLDSGRKTPEILEEAIKPVTIMPYSDRSKLSIPSVTRILNKTMSVQSKLNLELWKQKMVLELGEEGFEKYSQELLLNGKQFHSSIQSYLIHEPFEVPSTVEKSWQSVQHVLKDVDNIQVIESHVVHSKLYYRGIVDCVALYRGKLCAIDWKKSDKPKNSIENTFDAPIQVASYIGALNSDSNYNLQVQNGLVVVGYTNGDPASVHEIDSTLLNKYWKLWLRRLQQYYLDLKSAG